MSDPQRITWPFEISKRLIEHARSKEAVFDHVLMLYHRNKEKFEREHNCKLEWIEIRIKNGAYGELDSIVAQVEFKKIDK